MAHIVARTASSTSSTSSTSSHRPDAARARPTPSRHTGAKIAATAAATVAVAMLSGPATTALIQAAIEPAARIHAAIDRLAADPYSSTAAAFIPTMHSTIPGTLVVAIPG